MQGAMHYPQTLVQAYNDLNNHKVDTQSVCCGILVNDGVSFQTMDQQDHQLVDDESLIVGTFTTQGQTGNTTSRGHQQGHGGGGRGQSQPHTTDLSHIQCF